jgi:hypothetical protein
MDINAINSNVTASNQVESFISAPRDDSTASASGSGRLGALRFDVGQSRGFGSSPHAVLPDIENGPTLTNARFSAQGRASRPPIRYVAGTEIKSGLRNRHLAAPERGSVYLYGEPP